MPLHQLTVIGVEVAHPSGHVDDGSERLGNVPIGQDDLTAGLVSLRPLQRGRQHHAGLKQHAKSSYSKHFLLGYNGNSL